MLWWKRRFPFEKKNCIRYDYTRTMTMMDENEGPSEKHERRDRHGSIMEGGACFSFWLPRTQPAVHASMPLSARIRS